MASFFPRFTVMEVEGYGWLKYVSDTEVLCEKGDGVFEPLSKIEIEPAKNGNPEYFHLRFHQTNKYWGRDVAGWLIADSTIPEEDTSKRTCTLFQWLGGFMHVNSLGVLNIDKSSNRMFLDDVIGPVDLPLNALDWETFVKMPKRVAFKADNGKYLGAIWAEGHPYLQFAADDPNADVCGFEFHLMPDGRVGMKSDYFNKFCRRSPNWIWADSDEAGTGNPDTLFWPVRIDNTTIALRNEGNNNFCKPLTTEGKTDCFNAAVSTITKEARLTVEELVLERKVYNVKYKLDEARIYNQQPFVAGTTTADNSDGDEEASISVSLTYQDERSYSFSRSISITAGVSITLEAGVMGIAKEGIEFSFSVTGTFEWADTKTTSKSVTATGSVPVPARTSGIVSYVGTIGTCDIPFTYTQEDISSTDGTIVRTEETDGIFTGVNAYNYSFKFGDIKSL